MHVQSLRMPGHCRAQLGRVLGEAPEASAGALTSPALPPAMLDADFFSMAFSCDLYLFLCPQNYVGKYLVLVFQNPLT